MTGYDVVVIGAGAAGLRAAIEAARAGAATVVVDAYHRPGGQYFRQPAAPARPRSATQARGWRLAARARAAGVEIRTGTVVWDATPATLRLLDGDREATVDYRAAVVATGAHELVAPVPGWTLPGVYTAGAVQALLKEHGVVPGRHVLFAGSGPLPLVVAGEVARRGVRVAGVYEATRVPVEAARRPWTTVTGLWGQGARVREGVGSAARLLRSRVPVRVGWGLVRVHGDQEVEAAEVARLDRRWRPVAGSSRVVACDTVAVHSGLVPATEVLSLIGADLCYRPDLGGWVPERTEWLETSVPGVFAAGDCAGIGGAGMSLAEGERAGAAAAAHALGERVKAGHARGRRPTAGRSRTLARERRFQRLYATLFAARAGLVAATGPDTVVCRCEEVVRADVDAAVAAGARTTSLVKSLTRCGMGPCQGRVCLPVVERLVTAATGLPPSPTTARAPLTPVPFGAVREC